MSRDGERKHQGGPMFRDYARAMKEHRYVNAIVTHGPIVARIARAAGTTQSNFNTWLQDATYRHPQIWEDDSGRIYLGRYGAGGKEYAKYYDV